MPFSFQNSILELINMKDNEGLQALYNAFSRNKDGFSKVVRHNRINYNPLAPSNTHQSKQRTGCYQTTRHKRYPKHRKRKRNIPRKHPLNETHRPIHESRRNKIFKRNNLR